MIISLELQPQIPCIFVINNAQILKKNNKNPRMEPIGFILCNSHNLIIDTFHHVI